MFKNKISLSDVLLFGILLLVIYLAFRPPSVTVNVPEQSVEVPAPQVTVNTDTSTIAGKIDDLINAIGQGLCNCDYSFECKPNIFGKNNNIQPAHVDVEYSMRGSDLIIKNVAGVSDVFGYSMQPAIFTGNKLILKQYHDRSQLKEGVIIYYKTNDRYRVHRIKGLYEDFLVVQGDNLAEEEKIKYDQIKYIVVGVLYE